MSFTINTQVSDVVLAIATLIEDLGAAGRHKLAADNYKGRHALAGYIRDKKAELEALLNTIEVTPTVRVMIEATISALRRSRAEAAKTLREYRERLEAERALMQAMLGGDDQAQASA